MDRERSVLSKNINFGGKDGVPSFIFPFSALKNYFFCFLEEKKGFLFGFGQKNIFGDFAKVW